MNDLITVTSDLRPSVEGMRKMGAQRRREGVMVPEDYAADGDDEAGRAWVEGWRAEDARLRAEATRG